MKELLLGVILSAAGLINLSAQTSAIPVPNAYHAVQQDGNSRVWQRETYETTPGGQVITHAHQYTELATGMNHLVNGQWVESSEQIEIQPDGTAAATNGQHQVYFPADIYQGMIKVITPDGKTLQSQPTGLSYDDGSNTVFIAVLTNSIGQLVSSNQVVYPNAFVGINADLRYTYRKSGFEQDVVLHEQPPTPESLGLNPQTVKLQLLTEFFNAPEPVQREHKGRRKGDLTDTTLRFGQMTMIRGKAFSVGTPSAEGKPKRNGIGVYKSWQQIQGRTFLAEELPLTTIVPDLQALPVTSATSLNFKPVTLPVMLARRSLPKKNKGIMDTGRIQIAAANFNQHPSVVMDYNEVDYGGNDVTFESGATYYISDDVYIDGLTINGGVVVKFGVYGSLNFDSDDEGDHTLDCETDPIHPAIFTAVDDDTEGETIDGSSGTPNGYYAYGSGGYEGVSPEGNCNIHDLRLKYIDEAFGDVEYPITFDDIRIENCRLGMLFAATEVTINNSLFYNVDEAVDGYGIEIAGTQLTIDGNSVSYSDVSGGVNLTNSLWVDQFGAVYTNLSENSRDAYVISSPFFASAGNNYCYLAVGNPFRNIGTEDIDSGLLSEIQGMTTYAPQDGSAPNTGTPDFGYHYPINEDSDYDGLPDWWEYEWFGNLQQTASNLDGSGNTLLYDYQNNLDPNVISFSIAVTNNYVNTATPSLGLNISGGIPSYCAVSVDDPNYATDASWQSYTGTNIEANLGLTETWHNVWIGLKGYATNSAITWEFTRLKLNLTPPKIGLTSPTNLTTAVPLLQLQGWSDKRLSSLSYDLSNTLSMVTNQSGQLLGGQFYDTNIQDYTTNYFQCFDIPLMNGPNMVVIHATDPAGNVTVTNFNFTLDYSLATNPIVNLTWPQDGMQICQSNFTLRGLVDDPTASVTATITDTNGNTNIIQGLVERNGKLWVNNLPLAEGTNQVMLWVTNAAGFSSETNFSVVKNDMTLALTNISGDLWLPTVSVSGLISDTSAPVWVNGVQGTNNGNGTWNANQVPTTEGGIANFDVSTSPLGMPDPDVSTNIIKPSELAIDSMHWHQSNYSEGADQIENLDYSASGGGTDYSFSSYSMGLDAGIVDTVINKYAPDFSAISHYENFTDQYYPSADYVSDITSITGGIPMWICNQEGFQSSGSWVSTIQQVMTLRVGGTSVAAQKLLAAVSAKVDGFPNEQPNASFYILPNQVTIPGFSENLGTDGWAFTSVTAGSSIDVTPTTSAKQFYQFGISGYANANSYEDYGHENASVYIPNINANSYNLSVTNPEFCVGQQVNFALAWSPSPPSYVDSVQNWTLPDKYVNEAEEYSYTCTSYSQNDNLLSSNSTSCWFINGHGGNVSVGMNLHFANGQYVGLAAKGNITVYRPTFSSFHNDGNGFTWQFPNLVGSMAWDVTLNSTYDGLFGVTQVINSDNGNSVYYTGGDDLLDGNTEIYGTPSANGPSTYVPNSPAQDYILFGDSPSSTAAPCVYMQANFKDYLRFQPSGNNSIYVTIATNGWYMNGDACQVGSIQPDDLPPASAPVNDDTFPTWVRVRSGGGN